jgi:hypothetical protein
VNRREGVHGEAGLLELLDRLVPLGGEVSQRLPDLFLGGAGLLRIAAQLPLESARLPLFPRPHRHVEEREDEHDDEDSEDEHPPVLLDAEPTGDEVAEGNEEHDGGEVLDRTGQPLQEVENLVHG